VIESPDPNLPSVAGASSCELAFSISFVRISLSQTLSVLLA